MDLLRPKAQSLPINFLNRRAMAGHFGQQQAMTGYIIERKKGSGGFLPQGFDFEKQNISYFLLKVKILGKESPRPLFFSLV
ncbi:MAG: hypothetical protein HQL91_06495 [Magnetococcales bacterium]|nr:hypothetical protein [Magnetococcales bacterium]